MTSLLLVLLSGLAGDAGADPMREPRRTEQATSLELTATISRASWTLKEMPLISVTLTNRGTDALWLPRISHGEGTPEVERHPHNAWVTVVNQRGKELEEDCHLDARREGERSYRVLAPGQSMNWTMLIYCRNWGDGGEFTARVHFWNREREPPPPAPAARPLREKVDSNQVSFSMRKPGPVGKR